MGIPNDAVLERQGTQHAAPQPAALLSNLSLAARYALVRHHSLALSAPLSAEDQCVQSMPDASPTKWHLAHTTWFFETFVLGPNAPWHPKSDPRFNHLFNSYYEAVGARHPTSCAARALPARCWSFPAPRAARAGPTPST